MKNEKVKTKIKNQKPANSNVVKSIFCFYFFILRFYFLSFVFPPRFNGAKLGRLARRQNSRKTTHKKRKSQAENDDPRRKRGGKIEQRMHLPVGLYYRR